MIDKNMERILAVHSNLSASTIQTIESAADIDGHMCVYVTLARNLNAVCPCDSCHHIQSNGYYIRRIIISDRLFENTTVFLKIPL